MVAPEASAPTLKSILSEDPLLAKYQIVEATEIVIGEAVIVVAKNDEGIIGIGNVVRGKYITPEAARAKCIEHALDRISHLRVERAERELKQQKWRGRYGEERPLSLDERVEALADEYENAITDGDGDVSRSVYEAAVRGRQEFRTLYREAKQKLASVPPFPPTDEMRWRDPRKLTEPKEHERNAIYLHLENGDVLLADASAYANYVGHSVCDEWSGYVGWNGDLFERDDAGWHCLRHPDQDETKVRVAVLGWMPAIKGEPTGSAVPVPASPPRDEIVEALRAVIAATNAYLPPDGIDAQECLNRILAATDNPRINAALSRLEERS